MLPFLSSFLPSFLPSADVLSSEADLARCTNAPPPRSLRPRRPSLQFTLRSSPISGFSKPLALWRSAGRLGDLETKKPGGLAHPRKPLSRRSTDGRGRIARARARQRIGRECARCRPSASVVSARPLSFHFPFHVLNERARGPSFLHSGRILLRAYCRGKLFFGS